MAATKASERRKQRQEELREKLQGAKYLHYIEEMDERLRSGAVTKDELDLIKVRLDLNFKRLSKLLPDAKEVSVDVDGHLDVNAEIRRVNVSGVGTGHQDA